MPSRFFSFWSINAPLDLAVLTGQLRRFRELGLDGVVFQPRFYPNKPPYLSAEYLAMVSEVVLAAKELGMAFWLYDEDGWPSGSVGGQMLRLHPEFRRRWAELTETPPAPADLLATFDFGGKRYFAARRVGEGVDYLNPRLAEKFLELTHERYRHGLSPAAFAHIEAIFCDEPECGLGHSFDELSPLGAVPWTDLLPEVYARRCGGDLLADLPALFFPVGDYRKIRTRFWTLTGEQLREAFIAPIARWCRQHGKLFTAHVKGEEHPLFQVPLVGCNHRVLQGLDLPGTDALERDPGNDFFPRQVVSVAAQFGSGRGMAECFGGAGWGATPADLEKYLLWLGRLGITDFVLHQSQCRLNGAAIRDWPPSQPLHLNWREVFPTLLRRVREQLGEDAVPADTVVVAPYRGIMAEYEPREFSQTNVHNGSAYPDSPAGRLNDKFLALVEELTAGGERVHYVDELTLEESGAVKDGKLWIGRSAYERVIVAEGARLSPAGAALVKPFEIPKRRGSAALQNASRHEGESLFGVRRFRAALECYQIAWQNFSVAANAVVLEPERIGESEWSITLPGEQLRVRFADDDTEVLSTDDKQLRFKTAAVHPFAWAEGNFVVRAAAGFVPGANGTVATSGDFYTEPAPAAAPVPAEFVAAGYPFCREPFVLRGTIELSSAYADACLSLPELIADAARLRLDGRDFGWLYAAGQTLAAGDLAAGAHRLEVTLIPSTFNFYGPHRHIDGDPRVVSPVQYEGVKNFADRLDAPAVTRSAMRHFKPVRPPVVLSVGENYEHT